MFLLPIMKLVGLICFVKTIFIPKPSITFFNHNIRLIFQSLYFRIQNQLLEIKVTKLVIQ